MEISGGAQVPVTLPMGKELTVVNGDQVLLNFPNRTHELNGHCEQKTCAWG